LIAYPKCGYAEQEPKIPIHNLFSSKDTYMGPVAKKVAEFKDKFYVAALAFNGDGTQLAANFMVGDDGVQVWGWRDPSHIIHTLVKQADAGDGHALSYSPDGNFLAVRHGISDDGRVVRVWNAHTGEVVHDLVEHEGQGVAGGMGFSPDGKLLMLTISRGIHQAGDQLFVYRTDTWEFAWAVRTMPFQPTVVATSPDGKLIALGGQEVYGLGTPPKPKILVMDIVTRQIARTIDAPFLGGIPVTTLAWRPDGLHIAAGCSPGDNSPDPDVVRIFEVGTGKRIASVAAKYGTVTGLTYSPDGRYLIAGSVDDSVRIMDGHNYTLLQKIPGDARSVGVSRDSRYLAISAFPSISVWELKRTGAGVAGLTE
jgi:WD40 repeat protein